MQKTYVSREDWESFAELVGGDVQCVWGSCKTRIDFVLPETGTRARLNGAMIKTELGRHYYGREEDYDHVRVDIYFGTAFNFFGEGARSQETWHEAQDALTMLTGEDAS